MLVANNSLRNYGNNHKRIIENHVFLMLFGSKNADECFGVDQNGGANISNNSF